jgi:dienelactone hydrolase
MNPVTPLRLALGLATIVAFALFAPFARAAQDPSRDGPNPVGWRKVKVADDAPGAMLDAAIFYPAAKNKEDAEPAASGPWPVCVFSPGGPAPSWQGYDDFATRFASWGMATLVVAFGDRTAEKRAPQFDAARSWLEKQNGSKDSFLQGKLDVKRFVAAGHSRGGAAAIYAAVDAKSWAGCVTDGAALRALPPKYATPTLLIGSPEDKTLPALYDSMKKPRWLVVVAGMDHYMTPPDKRDIVKACAAAWIGERFLRIKEFKAWTSGEHAKKDKKDGVFADWRVEE